MDLNKNPDYRELPTQKRTFGQRMLVILTMGIVRIREPYYHGFAAQVAFFYMLSIVPLTILLAQMLGAIFRTTIDEYTQWFVEHLGGSLGEQVQNLATFTPAGAVNIVFLAVALWAASRGQFALTRIINYTMSQGQHTGRGFWVERIRSVLTMFLMLLAIVVAIGFVVYGSALMALILPQSQMWLLLRWPVTWAVMTLILAFIYWILPMDRPRFRDVLPGSVLASVGLGIVTWGYTVYLNGVARYDIIYGALANIVALMFWFYFMAWVLVLGVMFNKLLIDTRGGVPKYD